MKHLQIDPDIRKATTLPTSFYEDPSFFELSGEKIFASTWQYVSMLGY